MRQDTDMALTRTTVMAAEEDLAVIRAAAARRGVAMTELIRDAIHLAALAERRWYEPFYSGPFTRLPPVAADESVDVIGDGPAPEVLYYQDAVALPG